MSLENSKHFYDDKHFRYGINLWNGEPNKPVFYTKEMSLKIRDIRKPVRDLQMDIVEYPDFLAIRLYEDNFVQYEGTVRERIIDYVDRVKRLIESYGVRCELEGRPGEGILRRN